MRVRLAVFVAAILSLVILEVGAQPVILSAEVTHRCAWVSGPVSGGAGSLDICQSIRPYTQWDGAGQPSVQPRTGHYACLSLRKPLTATAHSVCGEPKLQGAPATVPHPAPFVMDPLMQQATIEFSLNGECGSISTKMTFSADGVPSLNQNVFEEVSFLEGLYGARAGGSVGSYRFASAAGTITSSCRGTGMLSNLGEMYQATGAAVIVGDGF